MGRKRIYKILSELGPPGFNQRSFLNAVIREFKRTCEKHPQALPCVDVALRDATEHVDLTFDMIALLRRASYEVSQENEPGIFSGIPIGYDQEAREHINRLKRLYLIDYGNEAPVMLARMGNCSGLVEYWRPLYLRASYELCQEEDE